MQNIVGRALDGMRPFVDGNKVVPFRIRGNVRNLDLWLRAKQCTADAVKARPGREKTKPRCWPGFYLVNFPKDLIPYLGFRCLLSAFEHILQTQPKELRKSCVGQWLKTQQLQS